MNFFKTIWVSHGTICFWCNAVILSFLIISSKEEEECLEITKCTKREQEFGLEFNKK